jgi:hypothetical protein
VNRESPGLPACSSASACGQSQPGELTDGPFTESM